MVNRYTTFFRAINLTFDYFVLNLSIFMTFSILNERPELWLSNQKYMKVILILNLTWLLAANITGLYEHVMEKDSIKTFLNVIKTYLLYIGLICTVNIMVGTKDYFVTRGYIFYSSVLLGFFLWTWKLLFLSIRKNNRTALFNARKVVIVGYGRTGSDLHDFFDNDTSNEYELLGFFEDNPKIVPNKGMYLGSTADCLNYIKTNEIDEIFCTLRTSESDKIERLLIDSDKHLIRFRFVPEFYNMGIKPLLYQSFGHIPVISVRPEPQENLLSRFFLNAYLILCFHCLSFCFCSAGFFHYWLF